MLVRNIGNVDRYLEQVQEAAAKMHAWIVAQTGDPLDLRRMKFEAAGFHPTRGHPLNLVEQIKRTWTYVFALIAARHGETGVGRARSPYQAPCRLCLGEHLERVDIRKAHSRAETTRLSR